MTHPAYHLWRSEYGRTLEDEIESMTSFHRFLQECQKKYTSADLLETATKNELILASPSLQLIFDLQQEKIDLYDVHWRAFEKLVAELLESNGWTVELQTGTKDDGADILARKTDPEIGEILTVWQAKKLSCRNKVGISVIRELADTRREFSASKGILVTSSYLTRGALDRITRDQYTLAKIDRDELWNWILRHEC